MYLIRQSLYLLLFFISISCNRSNDNANYQNGEDIKIKTIKWDIHKDFEIKNLIKDIQYIKLEDNAESIFSAIDKLIVKNNRIYILDITGPKALFVFDITGKFLYKIGRQGGGPGEYSRSILNFEVNDENEVFLYDYAKRNMMMYDVNGNYVKSTKSSFSFNDFCILPNGIYLLSLDIYEKRNSLKKLMLTENLKREGKTYFNFHKEYENDKFNIRAFQSNENEIVYMLPVNDTLFILNKDGELEVGYFFDFRNQKLPNDLKNNYEKAVEERKEKSFVYIYNTPVYVNNYIFANIFIRNQKYIAVFDIVNNKSTYESLIPENFSIKNVNFPLCTVADSLLVSYIDADIFHSVKNNFSIRPDIDEHLRKGGTVICFNRLK